MAYVLIPPFYSCPEQHMDLCLSVGLRAFSIYKLSFRSSDPTLILQMQKLTFGEFNTLIYVQKICIKA